MAQETKQKIKKYRKPLNINLGIVIFSVIFVYIIICIVMFFNEKHIVGYEVQLGSLSISKVYQGIAIRDEKVFYANRNGYLNYYADEGEKIAFQELVYTIDETGRLNELTGLNDTGSIALTTGDLKELKTEIVQYKNSFYTSSFDDIYEFKDTLNQTLVRFVNQSILANLNTLTTQDEGLIQYGNSEAAGVVLYSLDGLETLTDDQITAELFEKEGYEKKQFQSSDLISEGDAVYKLVESEDWSIVIQTDAQRAQELMEEEYVKVKFLESQDISWGKVDVITNAENTFVKLSFTNSMIKYAKDRFIDIELITNDQIGLKIPNTSIVEKEFFLIPSDYIISSGAGDSYSVMRVVYDESGKESTELTNVSIYNQTDGEYYTDDIILQIGDQLKKVDSMETYTISKRGTLIGVYNMNKGYADFKQIQILYQNEEYSIVKSNTNYGLSVYDHIVLESKSVDENDFIYE